MSIAKRDAVAGGLPGSGAGTTPALNIGAGDAVVFYYNGDGSADLTVGPDSAGNTYAQIDKQAFGSVVLQVYASYNATAGAATTLGFNSNGNTDGSFGFFSVSGPTTAPLDINVQSSGTPVSLSSGTLAQAAELLAFIVGTDANGPFSPPSGWSAITQEGNSGAYWTSTSDYKIVAATTSTSVTGTTGGNERGVLLSFKEASGGGGTNLTPGQASIALSGPAPTLARTANVALVPGAASIALSGPAPTLARTANQSLSPAAASIVLAGPAPTLAQTANQNLVPAAASIVLAGPAPTLARTANVALIPGAASIVLTGPAPTLAQSNGLNLVPAAASIALSGPAPTVAQTANVSLVPGAASIALSGPAPTLDRTANVALVPGAAAIVLTGPAPTLAQTSGLVLVPGTATIALSGPAPSLAQTANVDLSPGPATIALSGPPPTVSQVGPAGDAPTGLRRWAAQMYEAYFAKKAKEKKDAERPVEPEATEEQAVVPPRPKKRRSVRIDTPEEAFVAPIAIEDDEKTETRKIIAAVVAQSPQIRADLEEVQRVREQAERDDEEDELLLLSVH